MTLADLVIVDYNELLPNSSNSDLLTKLEQAFGPSGTGLIGIRNVPDFVQAKNDLLPLAYQLAHLPESELQALEDPTSMYNAGWSHGKEKLKADVPDIYKGSFYFNPLVDVPGTKEDREQYPVSYPPNKWPTSSLPPLEPAAKRLGSLMKDVSVHLAKHIDAYAHQQNPNYAPTTLYDALKDTIKAKGRLLYYYPLPENNGINQSEDSWIGWHNDSGFLTCLPGDLYMNPTTGQAVENPPPDAGLYVVDRSNQVQQVKIPQDCMAIQMGECTQLLTGGSVVATPHCVRGCPQLARASLACFIDTPPSFPLQLPKGSTIESTMAKESNRVPPLSKRWNPDMTFGDFLQKTFQMYYEFSNESE